VRTFFSGMQDVTLIEIVVIRCYFNNNFILMVMILMNKVVRHMYQLAIYRYYFCTYIGLYLHLLGIPTI